MTKRNLKYALILFGIFIFIGFLIPVSKVIPVEGAVVSDWNSKSFWYEPWGKSEVHKGIDIFSSKGKRLNSSTNGVVLYSGVISLE